MDNLEITDNLELVINETISQVFDLRDYFEEDFLAGCSLEDLEDAIWNAYREGEIIVDNSELIDARGEIYRDYKLLKEIEL